MTTEPAASSRRSASLGRKVTEDLLYLGCQAFALETGVRTLARSGELDSALAGFRIDVRSTVVARAMRQLPGGRGDLCFPGPLSPGPSLAFGATPLEFLRHAARRGTSPAATRSGGLTWTDHRRGLLGWGGPRGVMTQVLAGAAFAFRQRGEDRAALVFEECSAVDTGGWHEGINLAGALRAPLIVVLDAGSRGRDTRTTAVYEVARSYGIALTEVADEPHHDLFRAVALARRRTVDGGGPVLIELKTRSGTDRWAGHNDFTAWAVREGGLSRSHRSAIAKAAAAGVEHAVDRIGKEPGPDPHDALAPVHTGRDPWQPWTRQEPPHPHATVAATVEGPHVR